MLVPPVSATVNVAALPSTTVTASAVTDAVSSSSSVMRPVAGAVLTDTPAGRSEPLSVTVNVSSPSASVSVSVATVKLPVVEPAATVSACALTAV